MTDQEFSVGIVVRTRDRPMFVTRALASVQAQHHRNWRVVLVNDGGDPAPLEAALLPEEDAPLMPSARFEILHLSPGQGRAAAFNRGVAALATDFVACLDDDDRWDPGFLQELLGFYTQTRPLVADLGGVAAQVTAIREELIPGPSGARIRMLGEDALPRAFGREEFFVNPLAYACYRQDLYPVQWIIRRDALLSVGGFPEDFDVMEDRAFLNRFLGRWRMAMLDRKLAFHHRRVARQDDSTRNVLFNSLDNPSYDWRLFADLALPHRTATPSDMQSADLHAVAAALLKELNFETSALWQKLDGEAAALRAEIAALAHASAAPMPPSPPPADPEAVVFDLWAELDGARIAHALAPDTPFAGRFSLSRGFAQDGTLLHLSAPDRRLEVQLPETRDWSAIEMALDGLVPPGTGLRCELRLYSDDGYLFETALVVSDIGATDRPAHSIRAREVHACPAGASGVTIVRRFDAGLLAQGHAPRLSVILPRQARNFRFCCTGFVVERDQP